ncbi:MAG: hypothetical protein ABEH65_02380, partial [Halobacteriales archaeon]
ASWNEEAPPSASASARAGRGSSLPRRLQLEVIPIVVPEELVSIDSPIRQQVGSGILKRIAVAEPVFGLVRLIEPVEMWFIMRCIDPCDLDMTLVRHVRLEMDADAPSSASFGIENESRGSGSGSTKIVMKKSRPW